MTSYVTVQEFKEMFPHTSWSAGMDAAIPKALEFASRLVDRYTRREPGAYAVSTSTSRVFDVFRPAVVWVGELAAFPSAVETRPSLSAPWTSIPLSALRALPESPPHWRIEIIDPSHAFHIGVQTVRVTGLFGFSTTPPAEIKQAVIAQAMRWLRRAEGGFRDAGVAVELQELVFTQALDPEVANILQHLRRPIW